MTALIELYKPLSPTQLAAIIASGWRRFSPDTPQQRMFYPKLHIRYAEQIARQWDATQFLAGYVVSFKVPSLFMSRYDIQTVGYEEHREYKVPINELELLNNTIFGKIEIVSAFTTADNRIGQQSVECTGYH